MSTTISYYMLRTTTLHLVRAMSTFLTLPNPPLCYVPTNGNAGKGDGDEKLLQMASFSLPSLTEKLSLAEERREVVFKSAKLIDRQLVKCRAAIEIHGANGGDDEFQTLDGAIKGTFEELLSKSGTKSDNDSLNQESNAPREGNLGQKMNDVVRALAYRHFLKTGKLVKLSDVNTHLDSASKGLIFRDEEYLGGVIDFAHDLSRYAVGRATLRDEQSVLITRDLVSELMACLLKFDFRNGPIRRKFDGTKYALKRLENILYELSVTRETADDDGPKSKRTKIEEEKIERVDMVEMNEVKARMEARDELREKVIKRTRDSQKSAKQAIFALHRGDHARADKLILESEKIASELLPMIEKEPQLRYGSFSNSIEEYAEAKLFKIWLTEQRLATPDDMPICNEQEFLGGLCDLTGEVGRNAVAKGTSRDVKAVQFALVTNMTVMTLLEGLALPYNLGKKLGPLNQSVKKLEQMLYELSLVQGGRTSAPSGGMVEDKEPTTKEDEE